MNDKADVIQRCIDEQLNHQLGDYEELSTENFRRWVKILEAGTFNPIDQIAINAALYSLKSMGILKEFLKISAKKTNANSYARF